MARVVWLLAVWCFALAPGMLPAAAIERELLHEDAMIVLEIQQPLKWAGHPTLKRVWQAVSESERLRSAWATPEFYRVLAARDFLEAASGRKWNEALSQMTAGGVWIGITPKPNERATLIITAANTEIWTRLESALLKTLERQGQEPPRTETYRDIKTYRIENSFLAVVGPRLVAASQEADLKRMIDGLLKQLEDSEAKPNASGPSVVLEIDLESARQIPDLQKALKRPADDAGQLAIFGGWLDVLALGHRLSAKLHWPEDSSEIRLELTAKSIEAGGPLPGFFARSPSDRLAPLLEPPGTIYSASWFRDYKSLWEQREERLTQAAREKMEKGDVDVKQQFSVFGVYFTPSEFFKQLGTQFRVVMVRADDPEYRVTLDNKLPSAALCVSLRDEKAFRGQAEPLGRVIGLISAFGEAKMLTKTSEHAEAQLKGLWFRDDEKAVQKGNRLRFNFNPTWTIAREHFILGSTRSIVTKVIDELDRQAAEQNTSSDVKAGSALLTERQSLSFTQLGGAFANFRDALVQGGALDRGLSLPESLTEFHLAKETLNSLGQLTTQAAFTEQGFEYQLTIKTPNDDPRSVPASAR